MNTPIIFILIPMALSAILLLIPRATKVSTAATCITSVLLAILATLLPEDLTLTFADYRLVLGDSLAVLGRTLSITSADLTLEAWIFTLTLLWNLPARRFHISNYFNALSLGIAALWIAVLAVRPFLYAALIVELIALLSVPLLSPRGGQAGSGLLRYLVFQTVGMAMILLSGWLLSGVETAPSASPLTLQAAALVLFGCALWLAVFPVHSWMPMIGEESHPWVVTFLLGLSQTALIIFLLYFLDRYAWLRNLPGLFDILSWAGVFTIAVAGLLAAFQKDLRRIFGYLFLAETGYALLAVGLSRQGGLNYLALLLAPRALGYWLWGFTLSELLRLEPGGDTRFSGLKGLFTRRPWISSLIIFDMLSLTGLPLFAAFPAKRMLWNLLADQNAGLLPWLILGILGILALTLRMLRDLFEPSPQPAEPGNQSETLSFKIISGAVVLLQVLIGLLPFLFLPGFLRILEPFTILLPAA